MCYSSVDALNEYNEMQYSFMTRSVQAIRVSIILGWLRGSRIHKVEPRMYCFDDLIQGILLHKYAMGV